MGLTLRNKHYNLFKTIAYINPGFKKIFIPDIGIIRDEWAWCEDNLNMIKISIDVNDINTFKEIRLKFLIYCRWRLQNPVDKYEYPTPEYTITDKKPKSNYLDISVDNISVFLVSK